ncbi:2-polyprenyl-3-methyl-5-hydroxy-6-metoxy-1,4-benzoquinol methylase [Rhizobiales bacterium GAS188]|nr:2-polyprenyl-3-methyl-5-hydroxy-6-metoxy-1,4-benzoquinol methylase [Rhizobiales bacterium GAS188]
MNRQERRAAQKAGGAAALRAPAAAPSGSAAMLAELGVEVHRHHLAGRLDEAESLCRRILTIDQGHVTTWHRLGIIAHQRQRHEEAVELIGKAIALNGREASAHFNIALAYAALGRQEEAASHYARAAALKPDYAEAHMNLGIILKGEGKLDEALSRYRQALAARPDYAEAHSNHGVVLAVLGRLDEAVACYLRALTLKPQASDTHNNLGVALKQQGRLDEAVAHFGEALALKPDYAEAHVNLASALLAKADPFEALRHVLAALALNETVETKALFVKCVSNMRLASASDEIRQLIVRALVEPWERPRLLSTIGASLVKLDPVIADCLKRSCEAWPARLGASEVFGEQGLAALSSDALLLALLAAAPICDIELERLLTAARFALLEIAVDATACAAADSGTLDFASALAQQCWVNEYVFDATDDELRLGQLLCQAIGEDLEHGYAVPPLAVAVAASYAPLHKLAGAAVLLERAVPACLETLLTQQLREPMEERSYAQAMPRLTGVEDDVSLLVQQQYEENPYPRWVRAAPAPRVVRVTDFMRQSYPLRPLGAFAKPGALDILVAGCGTGQHSIESARRFAGTRLLAVDLSLASLSYAQRKTREFGLTNIDYAQADILKLGGIGRSFDIIESSGVLHHLADPMAGWRVLVSLLRPGGLMRLGFYSEIARGSIVAARGFIADRGYGRSAHDIRRCRQELIASTDPVLFELRRMRDFYTTSDCRDLLFHVQEHRLTLPMIKAALTELGLDFLGFEIDEASLARFRARFPEKEALGDLDLWHVFETENPDTFAAMYQFWTQKSEAAPSVAG